MEYAKQPPAGRVIAGIRAVPVDSAASHEVRAGDAGTEQMG